MNIAIYGGTFNPIHFGHIGMALYTLTHTSLDELWLMVTPGNPLKDGNLLAQNELERLKQLRVSDFEFSLPRPSFTAQTLQALQSAYPQNQFSLLIGQDNLLVFKRWRNWQWIAQNFPVLVYPRKGYDQINGDNHPAEKDFLNLTFLSDAPTFDISSSQIRAKNVSNTDFSLA